MAYPATTTVSISELTEELKRCEDKFVAAYHCFMNAFYIADHKAMEHYAPLRYAACLACFEASDKLKAARAAAEPVSEAARAAREASGDCG